MKKYRLKEPTALYPSGTIAERHDEDLYYVLRRNNGQELKRRILNKTTAILDLWQVEENEVWEEITEDQREEVGGSTSGLDGCEKMNRLIEHLDHLNINYVIHSDYHVRIDGIIDAYPTTGKFFHKGLEYSTWYYNTNEVIEEVYRLRNQREMECRHPIETLRQYDDKNIARMECRICGEKPVLHVDQREEEPDHQALREESLKEAYIGELEFMDIPAKFVFEVHVDEKYAEAWRALLDNNKTP